MNNLQILVAGFNIDQDALAELTAGLNPGTPLTPETISAAYARISRDPRPVNELRQEARQELERTRRSNQAIVFDMGHSSIAEHAVFNLDIIGVSRLLAEDIERLRLVSYTEKSQRYVLLDNDFVLPEEVLQAGMEDAFRNMIGRQNGLYHELYPKLRDLTFRRHPSEAARPNMKATLEGWAKEDARYILALATETQLGMTINARNLELLLRRLAANHRQEARVLAERLYRAVHPIAPSLIRYTQATDYDRCTRTELAAFTEPLFRGAAGLESPAADVTLINSTPHGDDQVLAALLHSGSRKPFADCLSLVAGLDEQARRELIKTACRHIKPYDPVLREFEYADFFFELIVSASCFAQLKRHRMATITGQDYDPALGVTLPPVIDEVGLRQPFMEVVEKTEELYHRIKREAPDAAGYLLTNAHRRRVAIKVNARELYHLARIRTDRHAQWDIRRTVEKMLHQAKKTMPLTMLLASGKDEFDRIYQEVYR